MAPSCTPTRAEAAELEARAAERHAAEQADYAAQLKARADNTERSGKKPRGKPPTPPSAGARANDQVNLTDRDSPIMPLAGGGFEQCYNAPAAVDAETMRVVATGLTQALNANDGMQHPQNGRIAGFGQRIKPTWSWFLSLQ